MGIGKLLIVLIALIVILGIDFIALPLLLKTILSWFGLLISLPQAIIIMIFIYLIIGLSKKKG